MAYLVIGWRSDANQQASRSDGWDNLWKWLGDKNESEIGRVLFHCATQCRLGISGKRSSFIDYEHFELSRWRAVNLLRLRHLFDQVLYDKPVVYSDVAIFAEEVNVSQSTLCTRPCPERYSPRIDFNMVIARDNGQFQFAVRWCNECPSFEFQLGHYISRLY